MNRHARAGAMHGWRSLCVTLLMTSATLAEDGVEAQMRQADAAFERADIIGAMAWYRKAAEAGYAPAQNRLAYLLDHSESNDEAVKWYRLAAEQGLADAQYGLARMYASGEGVARDYAQATEWFTRAALQNHLPAIHVLALAHEKGQLGMRIGYDQAVRWLEAGVAANDPWSIRRLADAYRNGDLGLRLDPEHARALERTLPAAAPEDER